MQRLYFLTPQQALAAEPQQLCFLDTEGAEVLRELAVLDADGRLLYRAHNRAHYPEQVRNRNVKALETIMQEAQALLEPRIIVCHFAKHDAEVLRCSFRHSQQRLPPLHFICTVELAKAVLPGLPHYGLERLCRQFSLRVEGKRFHPDHAHSAAYDSAFTRELYLFLKGRMAMTEQYQQLRNVANPFSSSRVDDPFQDHADSPLVYSDQYALLTSSLLELQRDPNQQSRGVVVIGAPGSGKTHLMMRLAKEKLQSNPLFYIRQPNNAENVYYHVYARTVESFFQDVPNSPYNQLQHFLAGCLPVILKDIPAVVSTKQGSAIITTLEEDSLSLFQPSKDSKQHLSDWNFIYRHVSDWWSTHNMSANHRVEILQAIIKYCAYRNPRLQELARRYLIGQPLEAEELDKVKLTPLAEDLDRESFALDALCVLGHLSIFNEPLLMVFDQLEGLHNKPEILESFTNAVKEILSHVPNSLVIFNLFPERWQEFQTHFDDSIIGRIAQQQIYLRQPSAPELEHILQEKARSAALDIKQFFRADELHDILQQGSVRAVLNRAAAYYRHKVNGALLPESKAPPSLTAIASDSLEARVQRLEDALAALVQSLSGALLPTTTTESTGDTAPLLAETANPTDDTAADALQAYLAERYQQLAADYSSAQIIDDEDDLGKLQTLCNAFQTLYSLELEEMLLGKSKVPANVHIRSASHNSVIGFLSASPKTFTARIKNFNRMVIYNSDVQFYLLRDVREKEISGKVGSEEIEKLNHAPNGHFQPVDKQDRLRFELSYALILEVENRDIDYSLAEVLRALEHYLADWWLLGLLQS